MKSDRSLLPYIKGIVEMCLLFFSFGTTDQEFCTFILVYVVGSICTHVLWLFQFCNQYILNTRLAWSLVLFANPIHAFRKFMLGFGNRLREGGVSRVSSRGDSRDYQLSLHRNNICSIAWQGVSFRLADLPEARNPKPVDIELYRPPPEAFHPVCAFNLCTNFEATNFLDGDV